MLVCGGRDFGDIIKGSDDEAAQRLKHLFIMDTLTKIRIELGTPDISAPGTWLPNWFVIAGGARGADSAAIDWAVVNWCDFKEFPADWGKHGKRAGFIRNQQMLDEGKPDLMIAFPGGRGTADMVRKAKRAGVEVREITYV